MGPPCVAVVGTPQTKPLLPVTVRERKAEPHATRNHQAFVAADLRATVEAQHQQVSSVTAAERHFDDDWYAQAEAVEMVERTVTALTEEGQTSPTVIPQIEGPDGAVHTDCAVIAMSETGDGSSYVHCADGWEAWS